MSKKIIAVAGVSGVGKSYFLNKLAERCDFQNLQASFLIKEGARLRDLENLEQDSLRGLDIDDNQALLIHGFKHHKGDSALVVLDCHTVIDTPKGLTPVSSIIFKEIGVSHLVVLTDAPHAILARRCKDESRARPERSLDEISRYQFESFVHGYKISQEIDVPLTVCKLSCVGSLDFLFSRNVPYVQ